MSKFQTTDGIAIRYQESGNPEGPVLIFSNSLGTDLSLWEPQMAEANRVFRVVRYDQRGHGESQAPEGEYAVERLGQDVLDMMDALGIQQASFVGISLGAMTGLWLGMNHPRRFTRLVLASVSPHMPPKEQWEERIAKVREDGMEAVADPTIENWFTPAFRQEHADAVEQVRNTILNTDPTGYTGAACGLRDMDLRDKLGLIETPVLVVVGQSDTVTPAKMAEQVLQRVPGSQKVEVPAAHLVNVEAAEAFNKAVFDFLEASR